MRLTTKGRFAVTAMIDLALREHSGPVTLAAISERQQISLSYLEQLFGKLRRHELVESTRGPGGGYTLGRKADGDHRRRHHRRGRRADRRHPVRRQGKLPWATTRPLHDARPVGEPERSKMIEFLDSVSLQKLVDEQLAKGVSIEEQPGQAGDLDASRWSSRSRSPRRTRCSRSATPSRSNRRDTSPDADSPWT